MKNDEIVEVKFDWNDKRYQARVFKYKTTAVILPNCTVLVTNTFPRTMTTRTTRGPKTVKTKIIFDNEDNLIPLTLLRKSGNAYSMPANIKYPVVFAHDLTPAGTEDQS